MSRWVWVKSCDGCPFENGDHGICVHPDAPTHEPYLKTPMRGEPPPECPLRKQAISISLERRK